MMKRLFKQKPKDSKALLRGLDNANFIVRFIANTSDGAVGVPGLKAAAQLAIQIIDVAQVSRSFDV
jgi:hypothetical protein